MYSRIRSTPLSYSVRDIELSNDGSASGSGPRARGGSEGSAARRPTTASVLPAAASYRARSSTADSSGSIGTAAIAIARPFRLSMARTMSVNRKRPSGRHRSSSGVSGRCSIWRTTSYPKYPTAPPQKRGRPATSAGVRARSRASRSARGSLVSTSVHPSSGDHRLTTPRWSFQAPVGRVPRKE